MKTFSKQPGEAEPSRLIPCPVCRGEQFRSSWDLGDFRFVRCRACGTHLQNPQPLREALAARYDEEYFRYEQENEDAFLELMLLGLKDADFHRSIEPTLPEPRRVLDIGCATGRLLKDFLDRGWETHGSELCIPSADDGNRRFGVNIRTQPLENMDLDGDSLSLVHASHLIEHVDDPPGFAREVYRVLAPSGVFICVTPTTDGLQARLTGKAWRSAIADHVTLFHKRSLKTLLEQAGFRVERIRTWGGLARGMAPGWLKKPMDRLAKTWGFGDVVLMVARKIGISPD